MTTTSLERWRASSAFLPCTGLLLVSAFMMVFTEHFLSLDNLLNIALQASINGIIAVGMTAAILSGGIDLSVGAVVALSGTLSSGLMVQFGLPIAPAMALGLASGALFGLFNGACVAWLQMPPIIVTLATMGIARGLALLYTGGYPIDGLPESFAWLGSGTVLGLKVPVLIMLGCYAAGCLLLHSAAFGRYVYAIGSNELATRLSGVPVARYKMAVYALSGFTAAIAGLVQAARVTSGQPGVGVGFELDAIAAVVLGGTSIAGGRGALMGSLVGALLLAVLNNGLNMLGISPYLQLVIKGLIVLLAIFISRERRP
ncbi:MAG: ABC transporter permease [Curvibacter sp.]|nr:ABC transporter permease [Curvibacter sp.]